MKPNVTEVIPQYLTQYIARQDPSLYTAIDHASWRYILKISQSFFFQFAHQKYLDGLKETGISTDRIPLIEDMDSCLRKFGWRAVPVTGFIPSAAFMEFLSLGILPIACDMRKIEHINYTPAPDIVHEAAGHAPIIADPAYAHYLRSYGEVSKKAITSREDLVVYQAIRNLSDVKEDPKATQQEIRKAQDHLDQALAALSYVSEATLLSRMGWWTFEYGLIGTLENPKIYGAGLLSSMSESYYCLSPHVKKIPFSIECIHQAFDITRPQPQLYVARSFQELEQGLEELAQQMAFRQGGEEGLRKAVQAKTVTTTVLDTGVEISGILTQLHQGKQGRICYLQFQGPTQLSYQDRQLLGHGPEFHHHGFGTPLEAVTEDHLIRAGFDVGKRGRLELSSGIEIEGKLIDLIKKDGNLLVVSFSECTVRWEDQLLFRPEWGQYDMACGGKVISVYGGAADREKYLLVTEEAQYDAGRQKTNLTSETYGLNHLYQQVRELRDLNEWNSQNLGKVQEILAKLDQSFPQDWLLRYELLELASIHQWKDSWVAQLKRRISEIPKDLPELRVLIQRGLDVL